MTSASRRRLAEFAAGGLVGIVLAAAGLLWIVSRNDNAAHLMSQDTRRVSSKLLPHIRQAAERGHSVQTVHELMAVVDPNDAQEIQELFSSLQPSADSSPSDVAVDDIWWRNEPNGCVFVFLWEEGAVVITYGTGESVESIEFLEDDRVPDRLSVPGKS